MILIVCLDDRSGLCFNHRRQSQDRLLRARVLDQTAGAVLWMNAYSARQFEPLAPHIRVAEDFLDRAGPGDFCFAETIDPAPWRARLEQVHLYRWNRVYPADLRMTLDLSAFRLDRQTDFAGSSHPTITEEIYIPCEN